MSQSSLPAVHHLPRQWPWLRMHVFERDGWQCVKCGKRGRLECDHVVPRQAGGSDNMDNLQTLCRNCHIAKTKEDVGNPDPEGVREWDDYIHAGPHQRRKMKDA